MIKKTLMRFSVFLLLLFLAAAPLSSAQSPPRIFFSDLESGPNTGGKNNNGVWVTIWGKNFGADRGRSRVIIGGVAAADYPIWTDTKITFQIGRAARSGEIAVQTTGAKNRKFLSNGLPFTVRKGKIYFVARNGSDWSRGTYAKPWKSITHAKDDMSAGDVTYIENGVTLTKEDTFSAYLSMDRSGNGNSGKPQAPKALVAAPGARVTIGVARGLEYGIRTPNIRAREDYWVISQLHIIGGRQALDIGATGWKIVGNEIECPGADGQVGCVETSQSSYIKFYGNEVHNAGAMPATTKFYHAVYFSTDSNHIDVGWNHVHDNGACRAIQFHSSPLCRPGCGGGDQTGQNQYDLHVHDNLIHGANCNAINFATVNPSQGPVEAYNNVIYHVGVRDPLEGGGAFSCIYVAGATNHGRQGGGTVEVFNNTLYDCGADNTRNTEGSRGAFSVGEGTTSLVMRLRNNVVYQLPGEFYLDGAISQVTGERNLWFGLGGGPSETANNVSEDPQFMNPGAGDFHLREGSPARSGGIAVLSSNPYVPNQGQAADKDGLVRPQQGAFSLGAYEVPAATTAEAGGKR
jgi:IPT/TIG domain-containing protein